MEQLGFPSIEINGIQKLSLDSVANRERIIRHYANDKKALFFCSTSGGVDSMALFETLLANQIPLEQIIVVHAHLAEVEHEGVIEHIQDNINGMPLHIVQSETNLLDMVARRKMWFSSAARYCTSGTKVGPIMKFIRQQMKLRNATVAFNCTGIVAVESRARAQKNPLYINKSLTTTGKRVDRTVYDWLPVFHLTKDQIWDVIEAAGKTPHKAYGTRNARLNDRLSCCMCVLASTQDLQHGARAMPDLYARYIALERFCDHTMFIRTKQKTHYKESVDLITGKTLKVKTHVEKTVIKIPLQEKIGLPFDELRVQYWLTHYRNKEQARLIDAHADNQTTKGSKLKQTTIDDAQIALF